MYAAIVVLHVFFALAIIAIVLLQAGKGADIGSAFGGGGSQAVFGSMGTPTILGKITTAVAIFFMITSFSLAMLSSRPTSVVPETVPAATPAEPAGATSVPGTPAAPATPPATK